MRVKRITARVLFKFLAAFVLGTLYSFGLMLGAAYFLGAGHGTELVMDLVTTPLPIGPVVWPCVFVFAAFSEFRPCRVFGVILVFIHYIALTIQIIHSDIGSFVYRFRSPDFRVIIILMITVHLIANIVLWTRFVAKEWQGRKSVRDDSSILT